MRFVTAETATPETIEAAMDEALEIVSGKSGLYVRKNMETGNAKKLRRLYSEEAANRGLPLPLVMGKRRDLELVDARHAVWSKAENAGIPRGRIATINKYLECAGTSFSAVDYGIRRHRNDG